MKTIKIVLAIFVLISVIYYFWTGNDDFLPYVLLTAAISMLLDTYKELSKSKRSVEGYFFLVGSIAFASYGIALLVS